MGDRWLDAAALPVCFAASLCLHAGVIGWAFLQPLTLPSVNVAVGVASIGSRGSPEVEFISDRPLPETRVVAAKAEAAEAAKTPAPTPSPSAKVITTPLPEVREEVLPPPAVEKPDSPKKEPMVALPKSVPAAQPAPNSAASSGVSRLPSKLPENLPPKYPPAALQQRVEGRVILRALISAQGTVMRLSVHQSSNVPGMDESALEAVRRWRFEPALRGETPVSCEIAIPIIFELVESPG
jgi:protein TonB